MLDSETKRRIDTARDILVGKVPDPKSQVEQITIALIYKFMDDMDAEAEELGGERAFFNGEYARYAWRRIFDPKIGGHEMLNLYGEAIVKMNQNPGIPQLFRDIFKNAYLPYRDPDTLKAFLKVINDFRYDHSERLGDAFEYLLSVLSSQGDAGQFRTPRHIIDFMVEILDPDKGDTVLDPACGTAGFLISAYKRVLKKYSSNYDPGNDPRAFELHGIPQEELGAANGKKYRGDKLTPDERARLVNNIRGYDISPDMVRLSLVNLYLHGFTDPHIYEYDTLTSEERWHEYADVILANPPFMSPKGGIRPHKRFSVESSRSEVLFVDYMAEHLTPTGRAAIIVPEGIIFQSGKAYKSLRKMLVEENYLVGVISLPAGVFNPYSGVKTSILWLDRALAKKTDKIVFVKVVNDGFDLGAQRRPIKDNDMPEAFRQITRCKDALLAGHSFKIDKEEGISLVEKSKIGASGDYNLSGERYLATELFAGKWDLVELATISNINSGNSAPQDQRLFENGKHPFCRTSDVGKIHRSSNLTKISDYLNDEGIVGLRLFKKGTILFPKSGASVFLNHRVMLGIDSYVSSHLAAIIANNSKIIPHFLYYMLCHVDARNITSDQSYPSLRLSDISSIQIPLPPLSIQQEIVEEIEGHEKKIQNAVVFIQEEKQRIKDSIAKVWGE
jgi:type I restriction enzyme M protein